MKSAEMTASESGFWRPAIMGRFRLERFIGGAIATAFTWISLSLNALLAEEPAIADPSVRVEVQMISLPQDLALPIVRDLGDRAKTEEAYRRLQAFLAKGTATLVGWPIVTVSSGGRATIETNDQIRYPTRFEAGRIDAAFSQTKETDGTHLSRRASPTVVTNAAIPTEFETRNTGVSLQVEATVSPDGKLIDLNIVSDHVRVPEMRTVGFGPKTPGRDVTTEHPRFDKITSMISLTLRNGQRVLLNVTPVS